VKFRVLGVAGLRRGAGEASGAAPHRRPGLGGGVGGQGPQREAVADAAGGGRAVEVRLTPHSPPLETERERDLLQRTPIFLWECSSPSMLIGRSVPTVSVVSQLVFVFLCLASPGESPQVPM